MKLKKKAKLKKIKPRLRNIPYTGRTNFEGSKKKNKKHILWKTTATTTTKNGPCSSRKKGTLTPLRSPGYSGYWWNISKRLVLGKEI